MVIYLDNAATSFPKPEAVYTAQDDYLRSIGVNPGRGAYRRALQAEQEIFKTRSLAARLFNIDDASRIIFTANVTESLNLALKGFLRADDHVVTTSMEHNAMWRPLKRLERDRGIEITALPCPEGCALDPAELAPALRPETRLVAVNHASNVTGAVMPLKEIGDICRERGVPLLVDAAQTAGVYPIDAQECNISLLAFTGHKGLLGPTGTGGLYIAPDLDLLPLKEGGTGSQSRLERQPEELPDRFEAGTLNTAGLCGLGAGLEFILEHGLETIREHEVELTRTLYERLVEIPELTLYGPEAAEERVGVLSFNLGDIPPEEVAYVLDDVYGLMVRAGLHCSPQAHQCLGTEDRGAIRVGLGFFNTARDLEELAQALREIQSK